MPCRLISYISSTCWGSQFTQAWFQSDRMYNQHQYGWVQHAADDDFHASWNEARNHVNWNCQKGQETYGVSHMARSTVKSSPTACSTDPVAHKAWMTHPFSPHGMTWQMQSVHRKCFTDPISPHGMFDRSNQQFFSVLDLGLQWWFHCQFSYFCIEKTWI